MMLIYLLLVHVIGRSVYVYLYDILIFLKRKKIITQRYMKFVID